MNIDKENYPEIIEVSLSDESYAHLSSRVRIYFETMRSILYQTEIHKLLRENTSDYLIHLLSVNYDMAVIGWCKLFGSKHSQDTHYIHLMKEPDLIDCLKNIGITDDKELKDNLLKHINLHSDVFNDYCKNSIGKYRNQFAAHFDLKLHEKKYSGSDNGETVKKLLKNYPKFDIAIQSLDWLYDLISKLLHCKEDIGSGKYWAIFMPEKNNRRLLKEIEPFIEKLKSRDSRHCME
ncbi:MAG TPA: hypothetical protein VNC84_00515 [Gammaproteobacteria bacterium]|jgi:hypothetical protein|nr:hypothetical protein [Gammaproteobacteria bacterium]